jgi:hypothetical protein
VEVVGGKSLGPAPQVFRPEEALPCQEESRSKGWGWGELAICFEVGMAFVNKQIFSMQEQR